MNKQFKEGCYVCRLFPTNINKITRDTNRATFLRSCNQVAPQDTLLIHMHQSIHIYVPYLYYVIMTFCLPV